MLGGNFKFGITAGGQIAWEAHNFVNVAFKAVVGQVQSNL